MKFDCSVEIGLPLEQTVALWQDPDNLRHWQDGFVSLETLSGDPGAVGSKSKLVYEMRGGKFDLFETIEVNNLPHEFKGLYESKATVNTMHNKFTEVSPGVTRWDAALDYQITKGFMMKVISFLAPGMFRKQTQKWLDQFRDFAESQAANQAGS